LASLFIVTLVLLGVSSFSVARAAVTIQVTTTANASSADGACSLREAITAANTNATFNECAHDGSIGADTIAFAIPDSDTGCSSADVCTITLGSTLPAIDDELTINGSAQDITVSGNDSVRVMTVNIGKTLNVHSLKIVGGLSTQGAGIFNDQGTVTVNNSTFTGNRASGGAAIFNQPNGFLKVTGSTFFNNSAFNSGGAIYNYAGGTVIVANSTFVGNSATDSGGAIVNIGAVPGYADGILDVTNSTIYGNSGSVPYAGGIYNGGTARIRNTIVANSPSGGDCANFALFIADSHNLDTDGSCGGATTKTGAEVALAASLAENGGPTETLAIGTNSAAIDAGDDVVCAAAVGAPNYGAGGLDQRGVPRPKGMHCDIGAFEREIAYLTVIKHVDNSSGGSATAANWTMNVSGVNPSSAMFPGAEAPGVRVILDPGAYSVSESNGPGGYKGTKSVDCSGTLAEGNAKTCTITNVQFTPTPTNTPTKTPTFTRTFTPSNTPTRTPTFTPSHTATRTATLTPSNTPTRTPTFTPSHTATRTATLTPSDTPTPTWTATASNTPTQTWTATPTAVCDVTKPKKPKLTLPAKDAVIKKVRPTLKWKLAECAWVYDITVKDALTGKRVVWQRGWDRLKFTPKEPLDAGKKYRWFVQACNPIGCAKSKVQSFTIAP
jgi:CSLREA domain-containing protein